MAENWLTYAHPVPDELVPSDLQCRFDTACTLLEAALDASSIAHLPDSHDFGPDLEELTAPAGWAVLYDAGPDSVVWTIDMMQIYFGVLTRENVLLWAGPNFRESDNRRLQAALDRWVG